MKRSTKKVVKYLRRYIGCEIIRTKPAQGDRIFMTERIKLVGFTPDGRIKYCYAGWKERIYGDKEFDLPLQFTDRNWTTYKKALRAKGNGLNKWQGKRIKRISSTPIINSSFHMYGENPTLISASKHHMLVMCEDGYYELLDESFCNLKDWELA